MLIVVGASLLAMNSKAPRGIRFPALSFTTIASRLVPTRICTSGKIALHQRPCRSEPARDELKDAAGHQVPRVIVHDHLEQARSYKDQHVRKNRLTPATL